MEAGAKKDKLCDKIADLKATQNEFFRNMKDIQFMQQLPKANKVVEFVEYFELDQEICELPEQLKRMYEQIKYVERFMRQASMILNTSGENSSLEKCLEGILRYL